MIFYFLGKSNKYLASYASYIDTNIAYCNDREVTSLGSWAKNSGYLSSLTFPNYTENREYIS